MEYVAKADKYKQSTYIKTKTADSRMFNNKKPMTSLSLRNINTVQSNRK